MLHTRFCPAYQGRRRVELKTFALPVKWITKLAKAYASLYKKRRDAIEAITRIDTVDFDPYVIYIGLDTVDFEPH